MPEITLTLVFLKGNNVKVLTSQIILEDHVMKYLDFSLAESVLKILHQCLHFLFKRRYYCEENCVSVHCENVFEVIFV